MPISKLSPISYRFINQKNVICFLITLQGFTYVFFNRMGGGGRYFVMKSHQRVISRTALEGSPGVHTWVPRHGQNSIVVEENILTLV